MEILVMLGILYLRIAMCRVDIKAVFICIEASWQILHNMILLFIKPKGNSHDAKPSHS